MYGFTEMNVVVALKAGIKGKGELIDPTPYWWSHKYRMVHIIVPIIITKGESNEM